ncbi:MAG: thiamine pyrophosphate-binding protein [Desulfobacteraceae bacterium]|nr:thiamine pyrophosphate-binding protein [Desulfobacteraceae bacterium]
MKISELMVQTLKEEGVEVIFGIPSIHNIGFYDALRKEPGIRHVLCRHESNATHMADGYARSGKGVGVVVASTGPGVTYTISPLIEAFYSCSPVLVITSNLRVNQIDKGLGVLHELKQQPTLFESVTKSTLSLRPEDNVQVRLHEAISLALTGRPGPVFLEVPNDLWDMEVEDQGTGKVEASNPRMPDLTQAMDLLKKARHPLIIAGIEALHAGLGEAVKDLAEKLCAPVLTDSGGKGILPEDHPLAFGNAVNRGAVRTLHETCDVTLNIGSRLRYVDFKRKGVHLPNLIHADWDDTWVDKNYKAKVQVLGDVKEILSGLIREVEALPVPEARKTFMKDLRQKHEDYIRSISPEFKEVAFINAIRKAMPRDGILVVDNTILGYFSEQIYPSLRPMGLVSAKGSSPIGFSFPAAMGVKKANPETPVVAVIGDGGFLYGANELSTCVKSGIHFPMVVVNDNAFRMIDYLQMTSYQKGFETDLMNPDFKTFAKAFGVDAVTVETPEDLSDALAKALESKKMWLIELKVKFPELPFGRF